MRKNRLFISQETLDTWLSEELAELDGDALVRQKDQKRFTLDTAVFFQAELTGAEDTPGLIGKVKDLKQLESMSAEHYADSVILDDLAYQVVEGFVGTPVESGSEPETVNDIDLLARYLGGS